MVIGWCLHIILDALIVRSGGNMEIPESHIMLFEDEGWRLYKVPAVNDGGGVCLMGFKH